MDRYWDLVDLLFLLIVDDLLCVAVSDKYDLIGIDSFSMLTEIGMHSIDEQRGINYKIFGAFMAFHSIRTVKGRITDGESVVSFPKGIIEPSNVTFLEIYQSAIDAASFSDLLLRNKRPSEMCV